MKILYFFLFLWVTFDPLDPDPDLSAQINADPIGSGSTTLVLSLSISSSLIHSSSVAQHYILTHPELFPEPKRVKFIDYIAPWTPIRY
jgi:hypothetical protein